MAKRIFKRMKKGESIEVQRVGEDNTGDLK